MKKENSTYALLPLSEAEKRHGAVAWSKLRFDTPENTPGPHVQGKAGWGRFPRLREFLTKCT